MELNIRDNFTLNKFSSITFQIRSSNRQDFQSKQTSKSNSSTLLEEDTQNVDEDDFDDCYSDIDIPLYNKNECILALVQSKDNSLHYSDRIKIKDLILPLDQYKTQDKKRELISFRS